MRTPRGFLQRSLLLPGFALLAAGCSDATDPPDGSMVDCGDVLARSLAPGEAATVADTGLGACIRLAGTADDAEYLVLAYSANGVEQPTGAQGTFTLRIGADPSAAARPAARAPTRPSLHDRLRQRERRLTVSSRRTGLSGGQNAPVTPGEQRVFQVCGDLECEQFVGVNATARYVGSPGVVFVDDIVPAGGYSQSAIDSIGALFDNWLYPVDTTAFGRESDVDGNGQVFILLTDQVNRLSGPCTTNQSVVGYFNGLDLVDGTGSNRAEIFYGQVPDPGSGTCPVDLAHAMRQLPPVLIHEFQHMISFNRHVLLAGGAAEETWLNEGLSQFAEELGGRKLSNAICSNGNCVDQFIRNNILNAYQYLQAPELYYLVEPGTSPGTLPERGANWLFVRWLAEQAPGDSAFGRAITRSLLGADQPGGLTLSGAANISAVALPLLGVDFKDLLGDWHAANYLESRTDLAPVGRLSYRSWNLRSAFDQLVFGPYPLRPDSIDAAYRGTGTLRGGSGRIIRLLWAAGSGPVAIELVAGNATRVYPHLAVRRIK